VGEVAAAASESYQQTQRWQLSARSQAVAGVGSDRFHTGDYRQSGQWIHTSSSERQIEYVSAQIKREIEHAATLKMDETTLTNLQIRIYFFVLRHRLVTRIAYNYRVGFCYLIITRVSVRIHKAGRPLGAWLLYAAVHFAPATAPLLTSSI